MEKKTVWRQYMYSADFRRIARELEIDPVLARVMVNREQEALGKGVETPYNIEGDITEARRKFIFGKLSDIPEPDSLKDLPEAADFLEKKIREGKKIRIVGDYDVDGVTATYILYDALRRLGAAVSYDIPDRVRDGYGISERIVEEAASCGVDTILTCDNGSTAFAAITLAKKLGMSVVVTDHHEILEGKLPEADYLVNPHQEGDGYPFKEICGAVVAYKLIRYLSRKMGKPLAETDYLEFFGLATLCDVMPIREENRIIIREAMKYMPRTANVGFRALIKACGLLGKKISTYHLGFVLGPCINSEGRLSSAKVALELFLMDNEEEALARANEMAELNKERKAATEKGREDAIRILSESESEDHVIVHFAPELHESLAGIVAGRLRDRFNRPAIVFTNAENDPSILKGSARSIEGYNMVEKLTEAKEIIGENHFGGHAMAAGLGIERDKLSLLREFLNSHDGLTEEDLVEKIYIDVPMPLSYVTLQLAEQLEWFEPFGKSYSEPLFGELDLKLVKIRPQGGNTARITVADKEGFENELMVFQADDFYKSIKEWIGEENYDKMIGYIQPGNPIRITEELKIDVIYTVSVNEFNDTRSAQCTLKHYQWTE